ncbi:MAG: hypothetical protein ACD_47C00394G0001 [uncultured bacterium]|nr:MAG: hypothetical protein ACD_47C00394G0001 [uncultured bacterium]
MTVENFPFFTISASSVSALVSVETDGETLGITMPAASCVTLLVLVQPP